VAKPRYAIQLAPPALTIDASYEFTGILILNICLLIPIVTSIVNGIDSSTLNGLPESRSNSTHVAELQDYRLAGFT
jgi:hypothetical protein